MEYDLVVNHQFGDYAVGQRITDREEVEKLLSSPYVVKVAAPEQQEKPPQAKVDAAPSAPASDDKLKKA